MAAFDGDFASRIYAVVDRMRTIAEQISDPKLRSKSIIGIGRQWYAEAPGPATSWLEESDLDEDQRKLVTASGKRAARRKGSSKSPKGVDPRRK